MAPKPDLDAYGYCSTSESDDAARKSGNGNAQPPPKKPRKRRPAPQQTINKIWRRFSTKNSSKALSILPFDPVSLSSITERPNELLHEGYERTRDECSRKVKKIVQECRRINTRYRDPGFDLVSSTARASFLEAGLTTSLVL